MGGLRQPRSGLPAPSGAGSTARALAAWLLVVGLAALTAGAFSGDTDRHAEAADLRQGGELYQRWCATCHANDGSGVPGVAPPIDAFTLPRVDLSMRTGRMPLHDPRRGVRERTFTDAEREAVTAYLDDLLDLEGQIPEPPPGDPRGGRNVYAVHCAQCHGASGQGGIAGEGVVIPKLVGLDPVTIAAATREGPFAMPPFSPALVSDQELGDIAAFLDDEIHQPTSPLGLVELSRFEAVGFAAVLAALIVAACAWAGGKRLEEPWEEG